MPYKQVTTFSIVHQVHHGNNIVDLFYKLDVWILKFVLYTSLPILVKSIGSTGNLFY